MGFYDVVAVMLRRWYLSLFTVMLAGLSWFLLVQEGGLFTTSTVVTFSLPSRGAILPESGVEDRSVVAFAGVVANEINEGQPAPRYASKDAPLYGVGVRRGVLVGLPDSGGQWTNSYARAEIEIQIVGRTHDEVRDRQIALLDRVFGISRAQQANSPAEERIRAVVLPMTTGIQKITPGRLSRLVALAALLMSALMLGGGASVWLERRRLRHSNGTDNHMTKLSET